MHYQEHQTGREQLHGVLCRTWKIQEDQRVLGSGKWWYPDNSFTSQLPYTVEVHTNDVGTDGYMNYGNQHVDFNEPPGCTKGPNSLVTCVFAHE